MSGVFGVVDSTHDSEITPLLERMGKRMSHLPWYRVDTHCAEKEDIGFGRIGIDSQRNDSQPASSDDGQVILFVAGEFFYTDGNKQSLDREGVRLRGSSHAELALRLYETCGPKFVTQLEGTFCLAVWDRRRNRLIIANDRFGFQNLYYAHVGEKFLFSPEIKGILEDKTVSRNLNLTAISEYMRFQQLLGDKSFFEEVKLLPPASICILDVDSNHLTMECYWEWRSLNPLPEGLEIREVAFEAGRRLGRAVEERLAGAERPGLFLSGGLDSRCLLALAKNRSRPFTTITYGHPASRDFILASRSARIAGSRHHTFPYTDGFWIQDVVDLHLELVEGAHPWIHAHGLNILPDIRPLVDVGLNGFGGTILGGMFSNPRIVQSRDWEAFFVAMAQFYTQEHSWPSLTEAETRFVYAEPYRNDLPFLALDSLRNELERYAHSNMVLSSLFFNIHNHDRRLIFNHVLFCNAFLKIFYPFYDYRFVEFAVGILPAFKAGKQIHGLILEDSLPKLAHIPYEKTYRLPSSNKLLWLTQASVARVTRFLSNRMGIGKRLLTLHTHFELSLRHELREWAEGILFDERTASRGIFRPEAIRSLWVRHLSGLEVDTIGKIAPIMTLELMMRKFLDEPGSSVPATELE